MTVLNLDRLPYHLRSTLELLHGYGDGHQYGVEDAAHILGVDLATVRRWEAEAVEMAGATGPHEEDA
jgi:DNA-directed RNA polymerase specialized sigma24 family protein